MEVVENALYLTHDVLNPQKVEKGLRVAGVREGSLWCLR
jgi:hypothetical protein